MARNANYTRKSATCSDSRRCLCENIAEERGEERRDCCVCGARRRRRNRSSDSSLTRAAAAAGAGGGGVGSNMRILAVAALTAVSAASAFAPCHSRELHGGGHVTTTQTARAPWRHRRTKIDGQLQRSDIWGRRPYGGPRQHQPPGEARTRSASAAALSASRSSSDDDNNNVPSGLFGLFRRGGKSNKSNGGAKRLAPPSLSGDALSSLRQEEMDECALLAAEGGANVEQVESICFDPRSFDSSKPPVAVESTLPGGVEVRGGELDDDDDDDDIEEAQAVNGADDEDEDRGLEPVVAESAVPQPPRDEEDGHDEICVPTFDEPASPSFELPEPFDVTVNADGEVNEERDDIGDDDDGEEEDEEEAEAPRPRALNDRGLVLVDSFSPFHGRYLSKMAREAYGAGVVSVLSAYVTGYLYQERGMTEHLSMRLPDVNDYGPDGEVERWVNQLPFEIVGIICESDSGLDDAERLGEALGLYPDRHDGYNAGRRDKFLMNEACRRHGLRVVEQRLCETEEEALDFALEMGIDEEAINGDVVVGSGDANDETMIEDLVGRVEKEGGIDGLRANGDTGHAQAGVEEGGQEETTEVTMDDLDVTEELCKEDEAEAEAAEAQSVNGDIVADTDTSVNGDAAANESSQENTDQQQPQQENAIEERDDDEYIPSNPGVLGLATNGPSSKNYVVVKPTRGVASDSVHLCPSLTSVSNAFRSIHGTTIFGSTHGEKHSSVLVQQFAKGTEYAVDIVSKAGRHKVAALWKYDKRPANGAPFVYHATELVDADTDVGRAVCEYAMESLDALDVHWGMSHTEIIVDEDEDGEIEPRLVEVNCRQHNTDFAPLTTACIGYNALDMLLAAYLGDADEFPPGTEHKRLPWNDLPDLPVTRSYGAIVHLVSHAEGTLKRVNEEALEEIGSMKGVVAMEVYPQCSDVGGEIKKTVDIRTDAGWCHLMGDDKEEFKGQYDRIVELMPKLFVTKEEEEEEGSRQRSEEEGAASAAAAPEEELEAASGDGS